MNRKFDNLGRIVIPKEMREKLGFTSNDEALILLEKDKIIVTNPNKKDKFRKYLNDCIAKCPDEKVESYLIEVLDQYDKYK